MNTSGSAPLFAEERRDRILEMLKKTSKLLVPELCEHFDVSPATIRNDLRDLENAGKLKRTHGGAIPAVKTGFEADAYRKEVERIDEKQRIARYAATLVEDGDTIVLDTGSTTLELAALLTVKRNLTVVTNDVKIAACLEGGSGIGIVLIGGLLRRGFHCTTGAQALAQLREINVDKAFMATNALSEDKGFTTPSIEQADVKRAMITIASQVIFLLDSHKFGLISFARFAGLQDADKIITDSGASKEFINQLRLRSENLEITVV